MVVCVLAKDEVAGSSPVSRSSKLFKYQIFEGQVIDWYNYAGV